MPAGSSGPASRPAGCAVSLHSPFSSRPPGGTCIRPAKPALTECWSNTVPTLTMTHRHLHRQMSTRHPEPKPSWAQRAARAGRRCMDASPIPAQCSHQTSAMGRGPPRGVPGQPLPPRHTRTSLHCTRLQDPGRASEWLVRGLTSPTVHGSRG